MTSNDVSEQPLIFYDIASGPPIHPFAPNPWKVRYALNFKRANFTTEWIELPDVTATRKRLNLSPSRWFPNGEPFHTLPALQDPSNGTVIGDSFEIAVYLDQRFPEEPKLFRNSIGLYAAFNAHIDSIIPVGVSLCNLPFNPETEAQSKAEFARRFGAKSWDDLVVKDEDRKGILERFRAALGDAVKYFGYADDGPFIGGKEPDYADFVVGGWLMMLSETMPEWVEVRNWHDGLWGRLHDSLAPFRGTW